MTQWDEKAKNLAESHVDWFLKAIRPLLVEHFIHGYKHGMDGIGINNNKTTLDSCHICGRTDGSHHSDCKYYNPHS
jgi:hypothetical protein